ncbi:carbohydrate esterase family 10 protein [Ceratobasidium sp. AG-Ba]|nr:carbohydrate esterase family 10 protein [Ceratobasidium sp. AG-Ba]
MVATLYRTSLLISALLVSVRSLAPTVTLDYGTFTGTDNYTIDSGAELPNALTAYLGIPYAAPPTGQLRYQYPRPPLKRNTATTATTYGHMCMQAGTGDMDEDCLTLNVFAPKGTIRTSKLPVVIWIHGGSFNTGSGRGFIASLISNSPTKIMGVSINYRVGALGFLPSNITHEAGLLNIGLYDQAYAIQWVHKYISLFGGDPNQVTLFGESAGATSVGYHLLRVNGPAPFQRVIMDSGGPTARAFPNWTYPLYQTQTQEFLTRVGCNNKSSSTATFACLRGLQADIIKNASVAVYNEYNAKITWPFQPVVDQKFIARAAHISWETGQFNKVPILTGFNSDEGNGFVPQNLNTTAQFNAFFKNLAPLISASQLATVDKLYPDPNIAGSPYANSIISAQFSRVAAAYGDFAYIAQVQANAIYATTKHVPVWKYHFAHLTPGADAYLGVYHASELSFVNGAIVPKDPGEVADQSRIMTAYWGSFIASGNPNTHRNRSAPAWPVYDLNNETQLRFSNGSAFVEPDNIRRNATDFWRSIPDVLMH